MTVSNIVNMRPDGPNVMTGDLTVITRVRSREMKTAFLCRCGLSADKPFCDGAHVRGGFRDPALLASECELAAEADGRVTVTPRHNGPLRCDGPLTVCDAAGRISRSDRVPGLAASRRRQIALPQSFASRANRLRRRALRACLPR